MKPILISFSGGRTSAFMARYLLTKWDGKRDIIIVYANTGKEREETLEFIDEIDRRLNLGIVWIEGYANPEHGKGPDVKVVDFKTAARNGEPFEAFIAKYGIPNVAAPRCSDELKSVPIRKYMQSLGYDSWETALGIRHDEKHRVSVNKKTKGYIYPLAEEFPVDSRFIRRWWSKQELI